MCCPVCGKDEQTLTDRELRKLDKSDLLQLLIEISDENEALRRENAALKSNAPSGKSQPVLQDFHAQEIGSLADAALRVHGVFEAAQAAADDYLAAVRSANYAGNEDYQCMIRDAKLQAARIVEDAERVKAQKIAEADAYCVEMKKRFESINRNLREINMDYERMSRWKNE